MKSGEFSMKKLALIIALALIATQVTALTASAAYNKRAAKRSTATKTVSNKKSDVQVYKQDGKDYLLKYNIDDLEAAPWLNGGKRAYDNETYSKYTPMGKNK
jgi:galactokinase